MPSDSALALPAAPPFFRNYTEFPRTMPSGVWTLLRYLTLVITLALIAVLVFNGPLGLTLFWGLAIPVVPAILVVAPGLWRQICPMATLNQLPRRLNASAERTVSEAWLKASFPISVGALVVLVSLREPLLNHSPLVLAGGLTLVLGLALAGGLIFKGRSGWCGTFCPMTAVERTYGQAPLVVAPNGHCPTCLGCQPNCYDLNPRAAVFKDVLAQDPKRAWPRRLFMALLPGLIYGYFSQGHLDTRAWLPYEATLFFSCAASVALYLVMARLLPVGHYRLSLAFSGAALILFYWFIGPVVAKNLGQLLSFQAHSWVGLGSQGAGALIATLLLLSGLRSERQHLRQNPVANAGSQPTTGRRVIPISVSYAQVQDRGTGTPFNVPVGGNLLTAIRAAGLPIQHNCHEGLCGLDAIAVCEGGHNMAPPGAAELATLRRMGLEGKARLACMCDVQGDITIDRHPQATVPELSPDPAPQADAALAAGIARVIVVGNGVAGSTAVESLRRASPSVEIHLIGDEPSPYYNRMALGQLISGESQGNALDLVGPEWPSQRRVHAQRQTSVSAIDRARKEVTLNTGASLPYDRLVLALGADAALPQPDFLRYTNAFVLRTAADALQIRACATKAMSHGTARAVVIGGGVLGVEAALALKPLGLDVLILERADRLMASQLDREGAQRLAAFLAAQGIRSITGVTIARMAGEDRLTDVLLETGERLPTDLLVACLGVQPRTALARAAGLPTTPRGIQVDQNMHTADPFICAIGDMVQTENASRLWASAAQQADIAIAAMLGQAPSSSAATPPQSASLRLKCDDIDVVTFGSSIEQAGDTVWAAAPGAACHWRVVLRAQQVVGSVCVGPAGSSKAFLSALHTAADNPGSLKQALDAL